MTRPWILPGAALTAACLTLSPVRAQRLSLPLAGPPIIVRRTILPRVDAGLPETTGEVVVRFREGVAGGRQAELVGTSGSRIARTSAGYALVQARDGRAGDLSG